MTTRVLTLEKSSPVRRALELMDKHDVGAIIVTSKGSPKGIVTEKDVVRGIVRASLNLSKPVGSIMSTPLISIQPETRVTEALHIMVQHNIRRLPVVKQSKLTGILVEKDIVRWLAQRPDVILDLLSITQPDVAKNAVVALLKELQLKEKI
ncbi:MAG: CBS domain-containing protein [Thaumarchaeota archaeon]|nr:CBS domain-containing protein [Nitrososphaerota archaeon]